MIEPMKKISVFLHSKEKKRSLAKIQNLGLLHLDMKEGITADKYRKLTKKIKMYQSILEKIRKLYSYHQESIIKTNEYKAHLHSSSTEIFPQEASTFHQRMLHLEEKFSRLEKEYLAREELQKQEELIEPWGDFDWNKVDELENYGIQTDFYVSGEKNLQSFMENNPEYQLYAVFRTKELVYFVHFYIKNQSHSDISFEKLHLPRVSISEIEKNKIILAESIKKDEIFLAQFANEEDKILEEIKSLEVLLDFESAKFSLYNDTEGVVFAISGYMPKKNESEIIKFLQSEKISYQLDNPTPSDNVPIKLRNNFFSKAFEPITRIFALPKYMELDPTAFFAPFFALFFGLCLGDIGYGAILLAISLVAYFKSKKDFKIISLLLVFLSLSTLLSGVLLNTFFGEAFFKVDSSSFYVMESGKEYALFSAYTLEGKTVYPAMTLALVLGFIQLSFGIILQAIGKFRYFGKFIYSLYPLSILLILWGGTIIAVYKDFLALGFNKDFAIGIFPIGNWLSNIPEMIGIFMFYSGLVGFFLFNNPDKKFLIRPVFGVWEAYQFIIGFAGDFLSYVRLFALGLASGLLGNAFNQVAFMVLPDKDMSSPMFAFTLLILIIGHGLNLALSVLGSFVHPLRLTFVEFYKNMDFVGGGREFRPFTTAKD